MGDRHIEKESAALSKKFETRWISISAERPKGFDPTEFSGIDSLLGRNVAWIVPAHKSELDRRLRLADDINHSLGFLKIQSLLFFANDTFTLPHAQLNYPRLRI